MGDDCVMMRGLLCDTQGSMGTISSQFTAKLLQANQQLDATRDSMTAETTRMAVYVYIYS